MINSISKHKVTFFYNAPALLSVAVVSVPVLLGTAESAVSVPFPSSPPSSSVMESAVLAILIGLEEVGVQGEILIPSVPSSLSHILRFRRIEVLACLRRTDVTDARLKLSCDVCVCMFDAIQKIHISDAV